MNTRLVLVSLLLLMVSGCATLWSAPPRGSASSLVDFLYPGGNAVEHKAAVPANLSLPLRVGLAFVPPNHYGGTLSVAEQQRLLQQVAEHFEQRQFIAHIEVIPSQYLRQKGFDSLRQLGRLYQLDVMALVSHDQVLRQQDRELSLLYWTIVGAYVIPGTKNRVNTFVDTTVFDLASGRLLLRAPGIDQAGERSTAIDANAVALKIGQQSFARAVDDMTAQLDSELDRFTERVRNGEADVSLSYREGYGGSGSADGLILALLLALSLIGIGRVKQSV